MKVKNFVVIWDNRKHAYVLDIVRRLVSGEKETLVTNEPSEAFRFKERNEEQLKHFEDALGYKHGELEYKEI